MPVFKLRTEAYKEFPCVVDVSNVCDFETQALVVDVFHIIETQALVIIVFHIVGNKWEMWIVWV